MKSKRLELFMYFVGGAGFAWLGASLLVESDLIRAAGLLAGFGFSIFLARRNWTAAEAERVNKVENG